MYICVKNFTYYTSEMTIRGPGWNGPLTVPFSTYPVISQKNGAVSKFNKKFISHLTWAQRTPSAAATVQVSRALPAVGFSCLLRGHGARFQDGIAVGKGFLCAPF
jgi:hypothetical protein